MTFSWFSIVILFVFGVVVAVEIYRAGERGLRPTLISLGVNLTSVLTAMLLSPLIARGITALLVNLWLKDTDFYENITGQAASMGSLFEVVFSMLLSSVLFLGAFFVIHAIADMIVKLICKWKVVHLPSVPEYKEEKDSYIDRHSVVLSRVAGVCSAFLITLVLTTPFMGTLEVVALAVNGLDRINEKTTEIVANTSESIQLDQTMIEDIETYSKDVIGNVFYRMGGRVIYRAAVTAKSNGTRVCLLSELEALDVITYKIELVKPALTRVNRVSAEEIQGFYDLANEVENLELARPLLGDALRTWADAWLSDQSYVGIMRPAVNEFLNPAIDQLLEACRASDYHSATANLSTLVRVFATILESDISHLTSDNYIRTFETIKQSGLIQKIDMLLAQNPYMSNIKMSSIAMSIMSQYIQTSLNFESDAGQALIGDLSNAINTVNGKGYATEEERKMAMSSYTKEYFETHGVSMTDEMADSVAETILTSMKSDGEVVLPEDVRALFENYLK